MRPVLAELDRFARARVDFAFETTLSGLDYLHRLKRWKATYGATAKWCLNSRENHEADRRALESDVS